MATHTFLRSEHLKSEKIIAQMFKSGQSFACYPLRLVYLENQPSALRNQLSETPNHQSPITNHQSLITNLQSPIQAAFSVPKKNFKLAVDRNRLRRRVREAYRLHKHELYNYLKTNALHTDKTYSFMILYTAKEETEYVEIQKGIRKMIFRFKEALNG